MAMTAIHTSAAGLHPQPPGQKRSPPPGLTSVAEGQPPLLACLNVGYPQVIAVDEGEEGGVGRADLGVHPGPSALGLDFQGLHGGHLGTQRPGSGGQEATQAPPQPRPVTRAHHEAILAPVPTVEEAVAGLEEEEAALAVEVVGGDAEDPQALPLPKELLLPRVDPMVGCGLGTHGDGAMSAVQPGTPAPWVWILWSGHSWEESANLPAVHARENLLLSGAVQGSSQGARAGPSPEAMRVLSRLGRTGQADRFWAHRRLPPLLTHLWAYSHPRLSTEPLQDRQSSPLPTGMEGHPRGTISWSLAPIPQTPPS